MFKLTEAAAEQVRRSAEQGNNQGLALRLAAQKRPDGSIDYRMGFDQKREEDIALNSQGIEVVMAPEYVPLLHEATLDYVEMEPGKFHFIFLNPQDANYSPPDQE